MENKKLRMLNHQYNDDAIWIGGKDFGTKTLEFVFYSAKYVVHVQYMQCNDVYNTIQRTEYCKIQSNRYSHLYVSYEHSMQTRKTDRDVILQGTFRRVRPHV